MCAFFSVPFQCWRASTDKSPNATGLLITWNAQVGQNTKQEGGQEPTVPPYAYSTAQIRPLKQPTSHTRLQQFTPRVHLTHLFVFIDIGSSSRFFVRCIGLVLPFEMSIRFAGTRLAPIEHFRCARCSTALRTCEGIRRCYQNASVTHR